MIDALLEFPMKFSAKGSGPWIASAGTDGMAAVLGGVDAAATSVGFPIRNMHTTSELAHTTDVLGCVDAMHAMLLQMDVSGVTAADFEGGHPRLDEAEYM